MDVNSSSRPYALWTSAFAAGLHYLDGKSRFLVGKNASCDIRFPDSMLSRFHATVRRFPSGSNSGLFLIAAGTAEVFLNGVGLLSNVPVRLNPGDIMTVSKNRYKINVVFNMEEVPEQALNNLHDNDRTHISWQVGGSHYVRYLDDKNVYVLGSGKDCDVSTPYERLHAKLRRVVENGVTSYTLEKSPYRECSVLLNGVPLTLRKKMWVSSGDVISASNGPRSIRLHFHCSTTNMEVVVPESTTSSQTVEYEIRTDESVLRKGRSRRSGKRRLEEVDADPQSKVKTEELCDTNDRLKKDLYTWFLEIEDHLTCSICFSIFYKPANVSPCNHKFCLACISKWRMQSSSMDSCPECRTAIRSVGKDSLINAFVSMFLDYFPEKSRDAEDIRLMNKIESDFASQFVPPPQDGTALLYSLYRRRDLILFRMGNMEESDELET